MPPHLTCENIFLVASLGMIPFIRQGFPYLRALPEDQKEAFLAELIDCYLEILPPGSDGKVQFIVQRLEVEAEK